MNCMQKDHKFKIKMVQEQWLQLKMKPLWGSNMKIIIQKGGGGGGQEEPLMRGNKNVAGGGYCRMIFSSGGDEQNFGIFSSRKYLDLQTPLI